jgi:hypothetical protein
MALLTNLNERLKSADVTVTHFSALDRLRGLSDPARHLGQRTRATQTPSWGRASNTSFNSGQSWAPSVGPRRIRASYAEHWETEFKAMAQ